MLNLQSALWNHLYGGGGILVGFVALYLQVRPSLKLYRNKRSEKKQHAILKEIEHIQRLSEKIVNLIWVAKEITESLLFAVAGIACLNVALAFGTVDVWSALWFAKILMHWSGSAFLGYSIGGFLVLRRRLLVALNPKDMIEKLRKRLPKD